MNLEFCVKYSLYKNSFRHYRSEVFEDFIELASSNYDDIIITHLQSDSNTFIKVYNGLNGSYDNPKNWDLLGFKIIFDFSSELC